MVPIASRNHTYKSSHLCLRPSYSIWRPYTHPVEDCPLALCDGSTIRSSDLVVCDNIQKTRLGETLLPLYNPDAKWYYLGRQCSDEVTIIKIFDSDTDVAAPCWFLSPAICGPILISLGCPHTAFYHTDIPSGTLPRKSIEMRALVLTKPEDDRTLGT